MDAPSASVSIDERFKTSPSCSGNSSSSLPQLNRDGAEQHVRRGEIVTIEDMSQSRATRTDEQNPTVAEGRPGELDRRRTFVALSTIVSWRTNKLILPPSN